MRKRFAGGTESFGVARLLCRVQRQEGGLNCHLVKLATRRNATSTAVGPVILVSVAWVRHTSAIQAWLAFLHRQWSWRASQVVCSFRRGGCPGGFLASVGTRRQTRLVVTHLDGRFCLTGSLTFIPERKAIETRLRLCQDN